MNSLLKSAFLYFNKIKVVHSIPGRLRLQIPGLDKVPEDMKKYENYTTSIIKMESYNGFKGSKWKEMIDINDFILQNYTEYLGDERFLASPTENTQKLWNKLSEMLQVEKEKGS